MCSWFDKSDERKAAVKAESTARRAQILEEPDFFDEAASQLAVKKKNNAGYGRMFSDAWSK